MQAEGIAVRHGGRTTLRVPGLSLPGTGITAILGHNGSGKSTLMQILARQQVPQQGRVTLDGAPLEGFAQKALARRIAYLPQVLPDVAGLTLRELVLLGRYPWRGALARWQEEDHAAIAMAITRAGLDAHADAPVDRLSGGERQRAWVAMALAQDAPLLMLDEPTAALDLAHQYALLTLLRGLCDQAGRGVIAILHDINLAARFADRVIALRAGEVIFDGPPAEMMTPGVLARISGIELTLTRHPTRDHDVALVP
ncbi:ABC transporter ATP-binding protein [Paroceanicella profunda]|uniref:ABC transporter ATP-binding protein n=1 Tax=Paroceanicella profunda TaxID=2579971 RepID=A0A5B8FXJ1_9RHOB|nr:ABC transporter ATP-binding protein [Paroceanicella profunda]